MALIGLLSKRNSSGDPEEFRLTLVEHLDELRVRIIRSLYLLAGGWIVGWFAHDWVYPALSKHMKSLVDQTGIKYEEVFLSFTDPFMLKMKVSFCLGLFLVGPFVVLQLWGFIAPGLKANERRPFQIIGPLSAFLFFLGCLLCWAILPPTVSWFVDFARTSFPDTRITQQAGTLIFFVINMMLAFGLGFQLPLVVYFLAYVGILPPESLSKYWRQAVVIIFIVAAIATPSADPLSMSMMAIPLCVLFMLSVLAVKVTKKKQVLANKSEIIPE